MNRALINTTLPEGIYFWAWGQMPYKDAIYFNGKSDHLVFLYTSPFHFYLYLTRNPRQRWKSLAMY